MASRKKKLSNEELARLLEDSSDDDFSAGSGEEFVPEIESEETSANNSFDEDSDAPEAEVQENTVPSVSARAHSLFISKDKTIWSPTPLTPCGKNIIFVYNFRYFYSSFYFL